MATRSSIEFNYRNAMAKADKLDEIASNLGNLSNNKLQGTLQNLSASWKGDNAKAYINKGSVLKENIKGTSSELHSIAEEIRVKAKRIYNAEMAALAIAEGRNY
jgi:uncharacterized protein YukE